MTPCILRKEVCTVSAKFEIFDAQLNEDGEPIVIFTGLMKGNFQQKISEVINNNNRTQIKSGTYLTPAASIPENDYTYCGGTLTIGSAKYYISDIIANYDLYGKLNYWTIKTR